MDKISKTVKARLSECETHLYFLWDARRLSKEERVRYKQVAAELRVLVADHDPKNRLFLSMMNEFQFEFDVQPPGPPLDKSPIPMVGWRKDPEHQILTQRVEEAVGDEGEMEAVLAAQAAMRRPVPFPEYVERGLAVYMKPYDYSYARLVRDVAQQIGSGHEGTKVDVPLAQMSRFIIGREEIHIATLLQFADLVIHVGTLFITHVKIGYGYEPKYFVSGVT